MSLAYLPNPHYLTRSYATSLPHLLGVWNPTAQTVPHLVPRQDPSGDLPWVCNHKSAQVPWKVKPEDILEGYLIGFET